MLQPLFFLFFGDLPFDDSLMPSLKIPYIPIPLLPLLSDPFKHVLQLVLPGLPHLPVHGLEHPDPPLLALPYHRTRAHFIMCIVATVNVYVIVQVFVTLRGR
jgi:hypothetical protein